jgi:hypothetical protein
MNIDGNIPDMGTINSDILANLPRLNFTLLHDIKLVFNVVQSYRELKCEVVEVCQNDRPDWRGWHDSCVPHIFVVVEKSLLVENVVYPEKRTAMSFTSNLY